MTAFPGPVPFDLAGPLPRGVHVLEASAGTGKTYTIAALVARYVAEANVRLPRLLVVTFTRAATAELRDRVRARLVDAADALEHVAAGGRVPRGDEVVAALADAPPAMVRERARRLAAALPEFDTATIATIHGFCQQVLTSVGLAADMDRDATFLEDSAAIVESVVDDVLVARLHGDPDAPAVRRGELLAVARAVVANPDAVVVPERPADPATAFRRRLAMEVRDEVDRRKRRARILSYDDLLTRLATTLRHPVHGPAARTRLRAQYDVALIDEFQDTDPTQWEIVSDVFARDEGALVLIGDPKQAIYSFRGADVYAYLGAARQARSQATLAVNWRSDGGLLTAYNVLFDGARLGHPDISYRPVVAAPAHVAPRLLTGAAGAPLRLRIVRRDSGVRQSQRHLQPDAAREHIARDLAREIVALLESGATVVERDRDGSERRREALRPGHLAVLVRRNADATLVQTVLAESGVPAVINGVGSVFATDGASEWLRLLEALERPSSTPRARAAVLTAFFGWSAHRVATASEDDWDEAAERLHRWGAVLRDRSVASLVRTVLVEERLAERLLARSGGERLLTDLGHVGELLHAVASADDLGAAGLSAWLRKRMVEGDEEIPSEERARRLESDSDAVQVLTIHRSKGLEFPVVYCPFLWAPSRADTAVPLFHDRDADERRSIDVAGGGAEFDDHRSQAEQEQRGEDLRMLYVALTRARHRCVVWWAPATQSHRSPLARVLFCRKRNGAMAPAARVTSPPADDDALARLDELAARANGAIAVETTPPVTPAVLWLPALTTEESLVAATFERSIDHRWRRTSYSSLTAATAPEPRAEPEESLVDDERGVVVPPGATVPGADPLAVIPPLAGLPGGTEVGTFVHAVLEHVDFASVDLRAELRRTAAEQAARRGIPAADAAAWADGLEQVIRTPLGPLAGEVRLRDVGRRERRDELAFELPLAGGDRPVADLSLAAVAEVVGDHLPAYAARLAAVRGDLRGYLSGSLDALVRVDGRRFAVVDYKTNRLAAPHEPLTLWHYRPAALDDAMVGGHYLLQALFYVVAAHRYLRWRLRGYDPAEDLAGVLYLFVRGMNGPATPRVDGRPCGVFAWHPPASLVLSLSDLLDGRRGAA